MDFHGISRVASCQFGPDVLTFRASLVLMYWPFGAELEKNKHGKLSTDVTGSKIRPDFGTLGPSRAVEV